MGEAAETGEISDGFGSFWLLCKPDCGIQVVRPGKAQCECDFKDQDGTRSAGNVSNHQVVT